jgi:hypothetical protein
MSDKPSPVIEPSVGELGDNPRYANYARDHGRNPVDQLAQDKIDWPGGCMFGFMLWNGERIVEFSKVNPGAFMPGSGRLRLIEHDAYDAWLDQYVIDRAARLVYLCMHGMPMQAAAERDMKPDDLQRHADWLRDQPRDFVVKVIGRVALAEQKGIASGCLLDDLHNSLHRGEKCPDCGYEVEA